MHKNQFAKTDSIFILFEFRMYIINEIFYGAFVIFILKIAFFLRNLLVNY